MSSKKTGSKKSNKSLNFSIHVETDLCEYHGMEVCIGKLEVNDLKDIYNFIKNHEYFESIYFIDFYNYSSVYHKNGILINDGDFSENNFCDSEKKSASFFKSIDLSNISNNENSKVILKNNKITVPNENIFLFTIRNESIYLSANGKVNQNWNGPFELICDELPLVSFSILRDVSAENVVWERLPENEEADGEIFGTHQFLVVNDEVIFYARTNSFEYPFGSAIDYDAIGDLTPDYDENQSLLIKLKEIISLMKLK
jgi:hypothetical protein